MRSRSRLRLGVQWMASGQGAASTSICFVVHGFLASLVPDHPCNIQADTPFFKNLLG